MNGFKNIINSLLVGAFIGYWLFVVCMVFQVHPYIDVVYNSIPGRLVLPPVYKMYTTPPKQIIQSYYKFYNDGNLIMTIDIDSLYHQSLRNNFPSPYVKRDLRQYSYLFYRPNLDMGNALYEYYDDSELPHKMTFQEYMEGTYLKRNLNNQLNFSVSLKRDNSNLQWADSVSLIIRRRYNLISSDPQSRNKFAYHIKDTIIVTKGRKL